MKIAIFEESPADVPAVETLVAEAFLEAPHTNRCEQWIVQALRESGDLALALVAKDGAKVVGYLAVSRVTIAESAADWYALGPIAVLPSCQGQGIGSQIMREALLRLKERGAGGCVVLGEPDYYKRFGFRPDSRLQMVGAPEENFMALSFTSRIPHGEVAYPDAFNLPV